MKLRTLLSKFLRKGIRPVLEKIRFPSFKFFVRYPGILGWWQFFRSGLCKCFWHERNTFYEYFSDSRLCDYGQDITLMNNIEHEKNLVILFLDWNFWWMNYNWPARPTLYQIKIFQLMEEWWLIIIKGQVGIKQCIKDEPIKWGFKLWILVRSNLGYTYKFQVYTGKRLTPTTNRLVGIWCSNESDGWTFYARVSFIL